MARTFTGPNNFALKQALRGAKAEFVKKHGDLAVEAIDAEESDYNQIISAVESMPFLAEKKLVIVYSLGAVKDIAEKIERLIEATAKSNELIIVERKPDKRSAYYKYLKASTDLSEFKELDERELANWAANETKKSGVKLGFGDAYYLVQRVGTDQELVSGELRKLIDYGKGISKDNIDLLTEASPQTNIFNLLDSAFSGNYKKAMSIYDEQRLQGGEPLKIFGMIIWQMHLVALVESAGDRTDAEIMKTSGLKPYTLNKSRLIARRMGKEKIQNILNELVKLDRQLKTTSVDIDDALKNLLLTIS
jgi:DNA polymerase-3 subunit delta